MLAGGEQLFGADHAEFAALLGADCILSALAAGDGEETDVGVEPAREIGEQAGPFVVGMSGDKEDARGDARFVDCNDGVRERLRSEEGGARRRERRREEKCGECSEHER